MSTYPNTDRYIAATPAMLAAFLPLRVRWPETGGEIIDATMLRGGELFGSYEIAFRYGGVLDGDDEVRIDRIALDSRNAMVRDHLIRTLALPSWMRDAPGGLPDWVSAGLVACAAAGAKLTAVLGPWRAPKWSAEVAMRIYLDNGEDRNAALVVDPRDPDDTSGWMMQPRGGIFSRFAQPHGPEIGDAGKAAADAAALAHGCALMDGPDALILPFPGGGRVWRRT